MSSRGGVSTPETKAQRVVRLAEASVERATGERRGFTITKFGRHEDGYLHARVTPAGGTPIYVHRKFGSWMAPGELKGRPVLKEIAQKEVKVALQAKAFSLEKAERTQRSEDDGKTIDGSPSGPTND
jgi:hypothetical protein